MSEPRAHANAPRNLNFELRINNQPFSGAVENGKTAEATGKSPSDLKTPGTAVNGKSTNSLGLNDEGYEGTALTPLESGLSRFNDEGMLLYEHTEENSLLLGASAFEDPTLSNVGSPVKRAVD